KPSTIPEQVAVAFRPPKSVAAVPDISEVMPMDAVTINTAHQPTNTGASNNTRCIITARTRTDPQRRAAGGPRRDWKHLSDMVPPANPPTTPNKHNNRPQCLMKNAASCGPLAWAKERYHSVML